MIEYLTLEQIIALHDKMIERYGGLAGIRDKNLLSSAIEAPKVVLFGKDMYVTVYEKAAAYLYHIVRNHPFYDANKRTGFAVTLVFLDVNDANQMFKKEDLEKLVIEVAKGVTTKQEIAYFLEFGKISGTVLREESLQYAS